MSEYHHLTDDELVREAVRAYFRMTGALDAANWHESAYTPLQLEILRRGLGDELLRASRSA